MSKTRVIIVLLAFALVGSNVYWAYRLFDSGVAQTYMRVELDHNQQALRQSLTLLPAVAKPGASQAEILAAARLPGDTFLPFEKDGFIWVGRIGLKFNEQGQLVEASTIP